MARKPVKPAPKKTAPKKTPAKKSPVKKAAPKKSPLEKTAAKKTPPPKTAGKASPKAAKRVSVKAADLKKAAPANRALAKRASIKSTQAKKSPFKKSAANMDEIFGQVVRLMVASPRHRTRAIADLEVMVVPPLRLGQGRLIRDKNAQPLAFACWAMVSDAVEKRLVKGDTKLNPKDWYSGDKLWLIDVIAPDAAIPGVLATLQREVFKNKKVRTLFKAPKKKVK